MPPKKDPFSTLDLRRIVQNHSIRFRGPVTPSVWPQEHKSNFDVVRTIQFLRYDKYMEGEKEPETLRSDYRKRVRTICRTVHKLLGDANANELSWRKLEVSIFERFDSPVIW